MRAFLLITALIMLASSNGIAVAAAALCNGDGTEEGRAALLANLDRPDADDAGETFGVDGDEAGVCDLRVAFAQALGRLGEAARAENLVIKVLDGVGMLRRVQRNRILGDGRGSVHGA